MLKRNRRWFSMSTLVFFLFFELFYFPAQNGFAQNLVSEVKSAQGFFLALPKDLGRVEITHTGQGPSLIHIQTAHGNYEAEQNIRKILHYLKNEHDFKTVFLEGSAFKLEPERLKLFKKHKKITYQILDQLMRRAFVKGSELFLLEDSEAQGFGVEHLETYVHNTRAFYEVLKQQKSTASFLTVLDEQIARLQSVFFSSDLRSFLKQKERYDEKEYDFLAWCELLRKKASKTLKIDLKDVAYQMDWPMLLRLFKLQELQSQINTQSFESEREKFLTNIKTIPKDLWIRVEKLLNANLSQDHLPNPETIKTFEAMIENLKADFDYEAYPQVKLFITHLILQSELDASRLQEEIDRLFIKISHSMMETDVQRKVFELYRHHELLTHLFELQLTPREYEQLSEHREKLSPKTLFENLSALNQDKRIELLNFEGVEEIEKLFGKSFEFYVLAKERDEKMIQNVEEQMQKQKVEKAVVITGGFHAEPFSEYFKEKLYNYALISPKMTDFEGQQSYVESMLQTLQPQSRESASATLESIPFASHSPQQILAMGFDPRQIALIFLDEAYRFLTSENTKFSPAQFNQMAMQGGAFKGFSLSFVKNEQGEDVFKITFPDGTIVYVGQQDVKQFIVRQTVGFDLGNPLNTIPGVSNQTAGTYLKLPQASSPAQSDSALLARPQSRAELRSIGSQNEEIVLKRSKETIVVGPVADPRDEPLSDLSLWTQLFGHRHSDENSISLKDLLADSIEAQQQAKGPFRFMDIGTGNGKIINLLKTRLQRMGLSKIEGVGIESDPGRWGMANSDPDRGYYVTDFLKLDETFPELMQKYDLLTLNAPQLSVRHLETDSQFQVKLIDFSSWLNQIKKIMKENGRLIIRLYEPESMVDGNEADWLHIESALLEEALKQHPDLQYTELGMNIQGLAKGSTPLGPAILVQFKNPPRAELRQSDDDDDDYSWVIPGGTLPADYQLDGRIGWDGLIGHRRDREATEIKFQDLVRNVLAEKRKGELLQFLDIGTGDGNFVSALKRVLNDQGISDVKGIGVDLKNATFLEADLTPGETYFQVDLQNPEEVITGVELNSQDFVFMNAPQLIKTVTSAGRKRFLSADDFSPWLKRAKSFLAEKGYLIIRLFEEKNDISDFRADWMKIESYLLWKALEEDPDLYFLEVRGDLADLPKGSTSVGPAIIVQKRSRAELRSGVDPLRRKDGGVFPEAVRAVEAIAATQNDVRRPVEEQPRRSDVEISAQAEAYQLFMEFTAKQQPELKDKLNEIVIHPADYDQFTRVHQPDVTEAAVISARFSPWDIRSILNQLKGDALLVIGYESYEADRANSDMQLLGEIKQEGLLEEFSMGQMPAGQHIIIARKARSELRADDVFLTDANEGSLFPEAVSAIEQIVASRNDPQPSDRGIDFRRMRISQAGAQKAAHQLFMMYAEKQQPQLRESLPSLMIFPTDYEKYQAQRTNKTEVVILSTAFSEHSIRLILESQRDDTLIVIGYEDDEKNVLEQHQKFLTRLQSEGLVKEFFSGEMATGQHILIARKARSELRSSFDKAFKGFAEMPAARTRLLAMIYENLHQNRSNKVAWYTNAGADIIHPLAVGNPDILIMNDRLDLFASEDFSDAAFQAEIDQMALNAATGEEALATFQEKGGALLPLLLRGFQQLGVSKEDLKAEVVRQKGQDVEQAIKFTFHWKHPAENEARLRVVYFLGRKPLQSLSDLPDKIEDFIVANKGLDLMIEKAPNYFKDLLRMDLEGLERESAEKTSAYRESQALIGQINSFRMNWLKKDGVILGDRESTEWPSSIGVLNREYAAQYSNIKYWKTRMYEFFSIGTLSKWGNGSSLIYQRTQGEPQGLKDREEKKKSSMLTPEIFQKAFQHRVGISEDDNQDFIEAFTNQFNQGVFDLVLDPRREAADDYDARATQALMNSDYSTAIIVRFEQILSVIRKGLDEGQAIEDIEEEVGKTQKFIVNYLRDVDQFGIILDTASLTSYNGISGIRAFIDYHAQALYILASRYAEARPDLKENPIANIFLRPILTDEEFDEAFKLLGRGVAIGDSEEFRGDFIEQYNEGFFDDVLNPQRNPDVYDYPQKINQAFSRSDISKALVLMFLQSLQVLRKGLDDGKSPEAILEEVKKITDKMSPHLNLEHDEDIFSGVIDDEVLEPYGGALGLMSYVNYIDHAVHILSDKYRKARSELRTDDEATSFEDSLNPELRRISLLEENEKNSQMLIPIALGYVELFEELASHGARADLEGTAVVDVELFFQDQQLKLRTSSGRSSPILGYDLLMKTLSDESKTDENGNIIRTQSIFFEPLDLQSSLARTMAQDNPNFIPYIYDDEYPVLFESQLSRDKKNMRNVNAIYVGGLYSNKFLKLEILKRKEGGDQWMPLLVSDVIFQSEAVSAVLGIDGKPFKMDRPDQIQRFISQGDLANILVRASFVDDPRKLRSELRSPEDYRERAKAKASILESEGYQYVLQIVPEDLRKNNGKSAQLSSVREMLSNISTENRWNENMTQRLTHLTHEILYNLIEHGEGAAFAITFDREGGKIKNIGIAALDSGVGIDDPNVLLNNSTRRKVRSFLEGVEPQVYGGNGFVTYMSRANDVVIESKGKRWQKSGMNHFKESHSDDVPEEGSKLSFTVDLSENVGPIHESYFLHRWTLFRLMKLLSENRWMPFGGHDIDGLTEVLMLSDDDLILKKQELFGEKNDTDRVGIIPTAIATGQYKTLDFKVYQKIIELSLELSNLQRSDFPEHATEQVKVRSEAFIQQWNERYQRQDGKPSREEGHLGVQFARADMEKGPGSIYEFNALRQFANDFLDDRDLPLQNKAETLVADITIILTELKKASLLTEEMESRLLRNIPILQESAKLYQQRMIGYLPNKEEVLQEYYEAASFTFRVIPTLIESIFRIKKSSEISSMYAIEDGFEVQNETSMHFDIRTGFEYRQREQIGIPNEVNALEHFRENPARVIAAYQYALEKNLPLSHQLRLALIQYQAEFQNWLDSQRLKRKPKESFTEVGRRFLKIMESDQSVMAVLWDMYRSGVLEAVVPELRKVQNLASNFEVHAFTVGQHTLYNLKNFESLRHASGPEPSEGEIIASRLNAAERRQMRLALLFHDLGKRISKTTIEADHAIVSARQIVPKRLKELGATQEDIQAVMWIVRDHMVLNAYAYYFKGDEFETKLPVIKNVIGIDPEASSERLKLLYLISLTDREALNPWLDMLNPDTLTRLNRIYSELEDFLASTGDHNRRHDIQALQQMAHEETRMGWETYKTNKSEGLRSRLENLNSETVKDYLSHMVLINDASIENKLMDRAKQIASDPQVFDELLERLFASFSLNKIRDFRIDQTLRRLLFLIHIQIQKESQSAAPLIYFNPYLSRTYERGYEILVGAGIDTTGFFEKATGVLLLHGFDIEEADIRTLSSGEILDKFHGFFHGDYPDEGAYQKLIEQITKDMNDVLMGVVPSIEALFKRANKPYLSQQSIESIETSVQFLEDESIYGVAASVFNLKTGNRLGLLHALSIILRRGGYNLVTAPVSTHPSMVNDIFYINKDGRTLTPKEKTDLVEEIRGVVSKRFIVFSDLRASRHELRNSDSETEASTASIRVPLAEAIAAIQSRISETESNEVFEELFTNSRLLSELVREYRGRSQRLDSFGLQAGWNKQAVVELVSNAMDWTLAGRGVTPIGRFAIGALQSFELLENEGDYVSWTSSTDGKNAYQLKVILTSEGSLDLELSSPVSYDFERGTKVEISKKGEVWKDYQDFLIKSFGLNTRVPIHFVENGMESILNPLDLQQEREIFLINGSQSEKLAKHFYPDDRIQVQVQDDVLSVRDWGLGMSPKTFLTRLIRPRSGNNENPNKKLTQEEIHQRVKVFYEKQGMIRADERVSSHISLQVAGVEIESVDVTGFNLPHMLAIELPAETNLSTERGNIALDEMTRDSMIAAIDKILNLEGAEKIPLLNAMAALLRKWQSKDGKQYEILLNTVQKKIRDWLEVERFAKPNQIVLPNRITLREEEKEEGQYFNEDAFQYLSLNADDEVIYLDDILFPFDPKKISKFKRVSNWYSDKGYQVWVVPFKESSNEIYFLHQNYIVVDEEHYRRHAANPAVLTQHINPILDYVPESLKTGRLRGHFILRQEKKTSKTDAPAPQQKTDTEWDILEGLKGYLIKQGLTAEQAQERIVSARVKTEEIIRENGLNQTPLFADSDSLASYDFHLAGYGALFNFLILYPDEMENLKKMGAKVRNLVAQDFFTLHDAGQIIYDYVMSYGAGAYYQKALKQVLEKEEREKEPWVSRERQFVAQALARAGYFFHAEFLSRDALRRIVEQDRNLNASAEVDVWDVLSTSNSNALEKVGLIRVLMGDNRDPLELWERKNTDNYWHIQKEVALQMLKEGDWDRALEFTRKIRHTSAAGEAYEAILNLLYQQKNLGLYREVLFEFENFTKNLNQLAEFMESSVNFDYAKASMLPTLSSFYRRINEDEKALQLEQEGYHLGLTLQTTFFFEEFYIDLLRGRTLNDDDFQSEGFVSLDRFRQANVLIAAKEWEMAKQVIASLEGRYVYTKSMDVLAGQIEASPSLDEIQSLMDEIFDRRFNDELDEAALSVLKAAVIRFAELGKLEGSYAAVEANLQRLKSKGKLYGREYERFVEPVLEKLMASEDLSNLRVFADKIKKEYPTGAALALIKSASIRVEQNLYADAQELWVEVEAIASQILPEKKDDLIHVYREMAVVERKLELAGVFSSEKNAILSEKIENEDLEKINQFLENAYFSKAKHRYQRRINLNMLRLPEPLNDADFSALAPFVTFLDHPLLAIVRPQTVSSLQSLLNSWTMSETEDFFDVINELNPRLIDVERFNTWLFKWATLFNGLRDHDGGLYLMIKKLTKAHSGVFWADEFDATHLPESMQDAALLMIVHYLRSGESESLLEEVSSIDDLRSQVSETNRRLERFSVAEINAIYNAELSESAGDVDPRTNWKKIKSMSDYLDYRSRIKPIHDRDLDILSMQINKAIEGQDNSPDISQRELIQNSLKAHAQAKIKEPIVVRSFIRKGAKHEWVKSVADKAGMELQDILGPLLVLDERAEITEADMSRGFFGIGFFTTFKDFDRVRLITSKGKGFPLYYLEFWRDPETKRIQVSIEEDEKNDLQYRGTIVEGIKEVDPNQNPIAQFIMANDNLLRYVAAVQDTPIIANGKPINEVLQTMGKVNTAYGELRLSTSLSGRKRVVLNGLFVESPEHENYFALVPKVYRDILFQSGMTLELPEKVSLTSSRNTLAKKEEVLPEIQRAVALASYQMIINLFLYDNVYPLGLTQDYLGEDNVSVDADVAQDAALIKQGLFNQVNFFNYVAGEDALENEKMIKNRKMIELLTVIEVDDRANPGFKTSLDNERLKVLGKKEGDFSGTSLTAKYYAEHGKALSERQNDFKPYAPEVLNQPRLQAFITLGDVLLEMMGESGVAIVLGESTTKDIPAFFMPLFNTISWDLAMTEIEHLTTHFYRIVAGESFDAEDLYSFFYHYTDILFHEAAHVYSGAHQREKMEGLFGWHKDQLLKKFLLNQTSLQQVVEEVRKRMTTEGTPLSSEASATPQNFLGYRAELRVVEEIARLRRNINKGRILGMKGKEMTPDEKMQILGRLKEIENSPNILDAHFDTFARAEKMSEFQQRLKDALIEEHPDLRDKLFFISRKSIDGFIAWLLIEPVPDSRTMGVSDLLVNERNAETRPVLFIGADYNDITTLFVTAHEVAHFLQKDTDGVGRVEKMHRWFVEGYQKHREMEVLMSLYKSSETMRVAVDELYRDFSEEHLLSEHVSERAGDVDEASILEKLTAMSSSVAGGYPHETIFVEALIAKLGESNGHEALRDIHQDGDYAKLESFLGKEKTDELRAVFMSARILRVYPLLEFISKSVALSWVLYFIEEDVSAEKSQKIKSVLETLPLKLGMHVNKLSEVQRKLLEMNTQLLIKSFDRTLWEADGELNVESALSKMKAVLEKNIESAASTTRGKLLIALSEMRPGDASSEGTEESGDGTRGELRSSDKISPDVLSRSELRLHLPDAVKRANRFFQKPYILGADGSLDFMRIIKDNVLAKFNITEEIFKSMENLDAVLELMRRGEKMNAFEKQIKQSLIALYPDLEKTLFFIPDDDGDTHGDVYWRMMHPGDRKAMGFLTTLDNGREERVVVFVRTGEGDLQTLVTAVHEVAHFLQDRSLLENYRLPLHRWLVEGYQKRREIEILSELYHGSPQIQASVDELINAELLTPTLTLFGRRRKANDPTIINLSIDERIKILSNDWTEHLYVHEGNFVDALIEAMGEEALRDIHQRADYTKMEDAIGQEKIEALRALFINWTLDSISNQGHPTLGFVLPILAVHLIISEKDFDQTKREKVQKFSRDLHRRLSDSLIPRYENLYMIPPLRARFESALIQVWNVYKNDGTEFEEMLKDMMQREIDYFDAESDDEDLEDDSAAGNVMSELRSELSEAEYLPQVTLKDRARDYSQNELVRLVTFVREHNIPDDVLLGSVSDSLDQLKKSRQPLKPFEIPRAVKVIDQVFDLIDEEITLLITESNIIPYHHDLLVIENSTGRLVAAAPIQIWGAGAARRIMPMWSRTFVQGQGYLQRAIQLLLKSKKIAGWRTEALDEGGDTRTGGVSEMYERMLATGDFERVNIRGTYHSVVQLKDRSELRIFAGEEPIIVPFRREDQRNLGKGTVEPLTPVGLVSRGIRFLTPEMYLDIRQNGFLAPNKRSVESGGSFSKFLDKVSLSISQNERFRSSATHTYGPFLGFGEDIIPIGDHASFVIRRSYIKDHSDDFQLAGRLLDQEESFRKEYQQGLDLIGLGDKQVYIKTDVAFPDEIHADAVPAEAIGGIIVHESLARKIAEWDKQFNLESLPLYLVTEDRHAEQLEVWQEPAEDMPSLSQLRRAELREALSQPTSDLPWYVEISFQTFQAKLFALNRLAELSRGELYHLLKRLLGREIFAEGFESDSDQASLYIPFTTQEQAELGILYKALFAKMDQQEGSSRKRGVIDYRQFDEKELQNESQLENLATSLASQLEMAAFAAQHDSNLEYQLWVPEALESAVHEKLKALMFKRQAMESLPQNLKIMKYPKNLAQAVDATIQRLDQRVAFVGPQADLLDYRPHLLRGSSEEDPDAQVMIALLLGQELLKEALEPTDFYKVYRGSDLYDKWSDLMTAFKSRMAIMASA